MSSLERYDSLVFAHQYEYSKGHGNHNGDIQYYTKSLLKNGGKVLEIGAGTGRITLELKKQGVDIVGIDNAKAMIDIAKAKAVSQGEDIAFHVEDILTMRFKEKFDQVIIPYNTLCFFNNSDLEEIFFKIKNNLSVNNGNLFFDFTRPTSGNYLEVGEESSTWNDPIYLEALEQYVSWKMEVYPQKETYYVQYKYTWKTSKDKINWDHINASMSFSSLSYDQYHNILKKTGFKFIELIEKPYIRDGQSEIHYFCHYSL